jgi:hypothetical protein
MGLGVKHESRLSKLREQLKSLALEQADADDTPVVLLILHDNGYGPAPGRYRTGPRHWFIIEKNDELEQEEE